MNKQEIFNQAYLGAKSKNFELSFDSGTRKCLYRGKDGLKCAVGWLIPDENYDKDRLEGRGVGHVNVKASLPFDVDDGLFLTQLHTCHDNVFDLVRAEYIAPPSGPVLYEKYLRRFAHAHNLEIPNE